MGYYSEAAIREAEARQNGTNWQGGRHPSGSPKRFINASFGLLIGEITPLVAHPELAQHLTWTCGSQECGATGHYPEQPVYVLFDGTAHWTVCPSCAVNAPLAAR